MTYNLKSLKEFLLKEYQRYISDDTFNTTFLGVDSSCLKEVVYPIKKNVFRAFKECPLDNLRVVMVGQDPYPQAGYATGLLFANPENTNPVSPSLKLVMDRIYKDFYLSNPQDFHFDITMKSWANQGILLLNSSLTVKAGIPGSHSKFWFPFMREFLYNLSISNCGLIYLLFGNEAQLLQPYINPKSSHILTYKHPAYFARIGSEMKCDGFIKINHLLTQMNNQTIKF